jgi:hypothetical protein
LRHLAIGRKIAYAVSIKLPNIISKPARVEIIIVGVAIIGLILIFFVFRPQFRFFDKKSNNNPNTTVTQTGSVKAAEVTASSVDTGGSQPSQTSQTPSSQQTLTHTSPKPSSQASSKPKSPVNTVVGSLVPTCNENQKAMYKSKYSSDVASENTYHNSRVAQLTNSLTSPLGSVTAELTNALNSESSRHQSVLGSIESTLNQALHSINCG